MRCEVKAILEYLNKSVCGFSREIRFVELSVGV
jgi:hypothetical protein